MIGGDVVFASASVLVQAIGEKRMSSEEVIAAYLARLGGVMPCIAVCGNMMWCSAQ
jgi:hypothetical protein